MSLAIVHVAKVTLVVSLLQGDNFLLYFKMKRKVKMAEGIFIHGSAAVFTVLLAVTFGLLSCTSGIEATELSANSRRRTLRDWEKEQQADRVVLPEQPEVKFAQFAGMISVDPKAGRDYFYFLVESPKHASNKSLTLWLNGGPGCSSLYKFAEECGPYRILPDSSGVYLDDGHQARQILDEVY